MVEGPGYHDQGRIHPVSTYYYLQCMSHDPPIRSETESGQHDRDQVEVAQQNEAKAQAELRAKEVSAKAQIVEAEAKAQATVEMARGQAEANRMLAESLTEPLLRNAWIEAIKESGNAIVVPDGSTPFVQVPTPTE